MKEGRGKEDEKGEDEGGGRMREDFLIGSRARGRARGPPLVSTKLMC